MLPIRLTIHGQPPRKSNSRRIVTNRRTGKPMLIKSKEALAWLKDANKQILAEHRQGAGSAQQPLCITFWIRYKDRRPDLSVELVLDFLESAHVISNDRYVFEYHAYKEILPSNPGVDILIESANL